MYKIQKMRKSQLKSVEILEGEPIELKIERIVANKEPIKDEAPEIFTERKDGVLASTNIRSDRWEIAADAMDKVQASIQAKREERMRPKIEEEAIKESGNNEVSGKSEA